MRLTREQAEAVLATTARTGYQGYANLDTPIDIDQSRKLARSVYRKTLGAIWDADPHYPTVTVELTKEEGIALWHDLTNVLSNDGSAHPETGSALDVATHGINWDE